MQLLPQIQEALRLKPELMLLYYPPAVREQAWAAVVAVVGLVDQLAGAGSDIGYAARGLGSTPGLVQALEDMLVEQAKRARIGVEASRDVDQIVSVARFVRYAGGGARYNAVLAEAMGGDPGTLALLTVLDRMATT